MRIGRRRNAPLVALGGERQAHIDGFDLHANVAVPAGDHSRLEHLARYVLRPPVAQEALELTPSGNVLLTLRRTWNDGTRAVLFEPYELIEKLAALVPKPRLNLLLYHGVLGPSARVRSEAVGAARLRYSAASREGPPTERDAARTATGMPTAAGHPVSTERLGESPPPVSDQVGTSDAPQPTERVRSRPRPHTPWAELLRRTFQIDVLACPECGGRLRLLATIEDAAVARRILSHLGLPAERPEPRPARSPPNFPEAFDSQIN